MGKSAKAGTSLASLVRMAVPLCKQAQRECPRTGPGRKPDIPDWVIAVLIMTAVLKRKKTKSSQYRFLKAHKREFADWLGTDKFPARSTYFDRYRRANHLFEVAVRLQGEKGIAEGVADAQDVAVDSGYDSNYLGERIEWDAEGKRTGRRFLCPENRRNSKKQPANKTTKPRNESHRRRRLRKRHLRSRRGKTTYRRRGQTVEPFNEWFKSLFELTDRVWHRGLENNQTQMMAALFGYQLLVRYNHRFGNKNGQINWILDVL